METLHGILERVVFENPDNGYTVGRFSARGYPELVTIVGNLASVNAGESLLLNGEWVNNPKYGRQFNINRYETILPANVVGLRKYLGSGLIKGIGPKMATRIVKQFGMDTMDVIEQTPEKLERVPGIGRKRIKLIKQAWEAQREIKNVMIFLQSHDVSTAHAAKIYKIYKNEAIPIVTENPYRLADEIYGIGFVTADTIAQKLGVPKDAPHRVEAGIKYVLSQKANDGHVFQHHLELIEACQSMLEQTPETIQKGIRSLTEKEKIILSPEDELVETLAEIGVQLVESALEAQDEDSGENADVDEPINEESAIYLAPFYYAELGVANQFRRLLSSSNPASNHQHIETSLTQLERVMNIRFAPQQQEAIHTALTERAMILTGGPGTGKTTTTVGMIRLFEAAGKQIALAAPTGRAAKRLSEMTNREAKTIHRLLEFSPRENGFKRNRQNPLEADVVIVDEMSMVDLILMNRLMQAIPPDATVILIGDIDQLPSVGAGNVLKALIDSRQIPVVTLTEIFRQARESMIVTNAHRINIGEFPKLTGDAERNFFFLEESDPETAAKLISSLIAERLPRHYGYHPLDDIQLLCPMRRGILGSENLNKRLQDVLNPSTTEAVRGWQAFRNGDKVMQVTQQLRLRGLQR